MSISRTYPWPGVAFLAILAIAIAVYISATHVPTFGELQAQEDQPSSISEIIYGVSGADNLVDKITNLDGIGR